MTSFVRQPLVHFIVLGGLFYLMASVWGGQTSEREDLIVVNDAALLTFIQQRSQIYEPNYAAARLAAMSAEERTLLENDFVQEEALYRESRKLGLDTQDYVIRRRMVQKMEFLAEGNAPANAPGEDDIAAYYAANQAAYRLSASVSFEHIFTADPSQITVIKDQLGTALPQTLGMRFVYGRVFTRLNRAEISDIFGPNFAEAVFAMTADAQAWQGPVQSEHGAHFIRLSEVQPARQPALEEVRGAVEADMAYDAQTKARQQAIEAITGQYEVRRER